MRRRALDITTHLAGIAAFLYPFFLGTKRTAETHAHAQDAPIFFALFAALALGLVLSDLRAKRLDAKHIALLGVLAAVNAILRLPGALGGASLMFLLPILCGYAFGARFGFLLGSLSMAASAAITGGIGPWLPFQMWALGWVGGGAGVVRTLSRGRAPRVWLSVYGWAAGLAFGALLNLWFWPFQAGRSAISYQPGLGVGQTLVHYWRFYVLTSLAWDSARAFGNVVLVWALGAPLLRVLSRFHARLFVSWGAPVLPEQVASSA
jgi:energy-coupling factor transport system substrate-specific component